MRKIDIGMLESMKSHMDSMKISGISLWKRILKTVNGTKEDIFPMYKTFILCYLFGSITSNELSTWEIPYEKETLFFSGCRRCECESLLPELRDEVSKSLPFST